MAKQRGKQRKKQDGAGCKPSGLGRALPVGHSAFVPSAAVGVFLLSCLLYLNTIGNAFTNWDDPTLILNNRDVRSLAAADVARIFKPIPGQTYQPLRVLSYAIDYSLWEYQPAGYHVVNFLLHATGAAGLFWFLLLFLRQARKGGAEEDNRAIALIVALLFAAHPVNVEAVAWLASRKYGLLAAFSFWGLAFHLKGTRLWEDGRIDYRWVVAGAVCMVCAMLSSPFGIVLPALLVFIECARWRRFDTRILWSYVPLAILSLYPFYAIRLGLLAEGSVAAKQFHYKNNPIYTYLTILRALADYAWNYVAPFWLSNKYPNAIVEGPRDPMFWRAALGGLFVVLSFIGSIWCLVKGKRLFPFCVAWAFVAWFPVSNIIVPISTTMADRYLYLPGIGVFLAVALLLQVLAERFNPRFVLAPVALALLFFCGMTIKRNTAWRDSVTLWRACLDVDSENPVGRNNYGDALREKGKTEAAVMREQARALEGEAQKALLAKADAHEREFRDLAASEYGESLRIYEPHAEAHKNMGTYHLRREAFKEAIVHLSRAVEIKSHFPAAYSNLGVCYIKQGDHAQAAAAFAKAAAQDPYVADYHNNLALAALGMGNLKTAVEHLGLAVRVESNLARAIAAANLLRTNEHFRESLSFYELGLRGQLVPQDEQASRFAYVQSLLGAAQRQTDGSFPEDRAELIRKAEAELERALAVRPDNERAKQHYAGLHRFLQQQRDGAQQAP